MSPTELRELLDVIEAKAEGLSSVGVREVSIDGIRFVVESIAGPELEDEDRRPDDIDPLKDEETFGIRRGTGHVPSLRPRSDRP